MGNSAVKDAYAKFQKRAGNTVEAKGSFPPILLISNKDGKPGAFVAGTIKGRKEVTINGIDKVVYTVTVADTNAPIVKKEGKEWVDTPLPKDGVVNMFASRRLDRVLADKADGTEVFINYLGKKNIKNSKGTSNMTHTYDVEVGVGEDGGSKESGNDGGEAIDD